MPKRIQLRRTKGWKKPEGAIVVSRPSKWGNPAVFGGARVSEAEGTRVTESIKDAQTAVGFFRDMLTYPIRPYPSHAEIRAELRGKDLCCWCPVNAPCHADVLIEIANE